MFRNRAAPDFGGMIRMPRHGATVRDLEVALRVSSPSFNRWDHRSVCRLHSRVSMNLRLLGIGCLLLLGSALSSCGDLRGLTSSGRKGPPARPGTTQLPGLGLGVHDHIENVDFAVAGD